MARRRTTNGRKLEAEAERGRKLNEDETVEGEPGGDEDREREDQFREGGLFLGKRINVLLPRGGLLDYPRRLQHMPFWHTCISGEGKSIGLDCKEGT